MTLSRHQQRVRQRSTAITLVLCGVALSAALVLYALRDNVTFFLTPSDLLSVEYKDDGRPIRLGGLVVYGSVDRDGLETNFTVTDTANEVDVTYHGIVPDLFREGQGVVVTGHYEPEIGFRATQLLAKHDENYMPPELTRKIEALGHPAQEAQ